jgi:hypothetical protein
MGKKIPQQTLLSQAHQKMKLGGNHDLLNIRVNREKYLRIASGGTRII